MTSLIAGTPYDMGFAQGSLLNERTNDMLNNVWNYFELQVVCLICKLQNIIISIYYY